jgi:hypothetical protein
MRLRWRLAGLISRFAALWRALIAKSLSRASASPFEVCFDRQRIRLAGCDAGLRGLATLNISLGATVCTTGA